MNRPFTAPNSRAERVVVDLELLIDSVTAQSAVIRTGTFNFAVERLVRRPESSKNWFKSKHHLRFHLMRFAPETTECDLATYFSGGCCNCISKTDYMRVIHGICIRISVMYYRRLKNAFTRACLVKRCNEMHQDAS